MYSMSYIFLTSHTGLQNGGNGKRSIRFRPSLIFNESHAVVTTHLMEEAINMCRKARLRHGR